MYTNFFERLHGMVRHKGLQASADLMFQNEDPLNLPIQFAGYVRTLSDRTKTSLKSVLFIAYWVHAELFKFGKKCLT